MVPLDWIGLGSPSIAFIFVDLKMHFILSAQKLDVRQYADADYRQHKEKRQKRHTSQEERERERVEIELNGNTCCHKR